MGDRRALKQARSARRRRVVQEEEDEEEEEKEIPQLSLWGALVLLLVVTVRPVSLRARRILTKPRSAGLCRHHRRIPRFEHQRSHGRSSSDQCRVGRSYPPPHRRQRRRAPHGRLGFRARQDRPLNVGRRRLVHPDRPLRHSLHGHARLDPGQAAQLVVRPVRVHRKWLRTWC